MELPDSAASPPMGEAAPESAADLTSEAPLPAGVPIDNADAHAQPPLPDAAAAPLPSSRPVLRAPQPPDSAALDNARRGIWVMNENHDGWVLLGADRKPVMRKDRSRVSFRFRDAARLAQELAASPDDLSPGASAKGGVDPVPWRRSIPATTGIGTPRPKNPSSPISPRPAGCWPINTCSSPSLRRRCAGRSPIFCRTRPM